MQPARPALAERALPSTAERAQSAAGPLPPSRCRPRRCRGSLLVGTRCPSTGAGRRWHEPRRLLCQLERRPRRIRRAEQRRLLALPPCQPSLGRRSPQSSPARLHRPRLGPSARRERQTSRGRRRASQPRSCSPGAPQGETYSVPPGLPPCRHRRQCSHRAAHCCDARARGRHRGRAPSVQAALLPTAHECPWRQPPSPRCRPWQRQMQRHPLSRSASRLFERRRHAQIAPIRFAPRSRP